MKTAADGNLAIAQAAMESGVGYFSHYPGSPVNRVDLYLRQLADRYDLGITFNDALNEHVAVLAAAGASFCGIRSMVVMKHVGMNIAADPMNYLGYTGVKGGMVIVIGTDPGATCSTGEEDVHWFVPQLNFPLFEPTSVAAIRECVRAAFTVSEQSEVPVLVFVPAPLCFNVDFLPEPRPNPAANKRTIKFDKDKWRYTNVGERAVTNHRRLLQRIERLAAQPSGCKTRFNAAADIGLITRGLTFGHTCEAVVELQLEQSVHLLNVERVFPLNRNELLEFASGKRELLVIEDQDGFLENQIKMHLFNDLDCSVHGKDRLSVAGSTGYQQVRQLLAGRFGVAVTQDFSGERQQPEVPERMGTYCEGCPHRASFLGIEMAVDLSEVVLGGDIGCSSLPPHKPDWLMCMNAGVGIAQGISAALGGEHIISTGGDGSLFHLGLISLMSAAANRIDLLHVLLDNATIAMTGHQASPSTTLDLHKLFNAIGVDRVIEVDAFRPDQLKQALQSEVGRSGVRVVWVRGSCALLPDASALERRRRISLTIHNDRCGGCRLCYQTLACPAIQLVPGQSQDIFVDGRRCMRCGVCLQICPSDAIEAIEA